MSSQSFLRKGPRFSGSMVVTARTALSLLQSIWAIRQFAKLTQFQDKFWLDSFSMELVLVAGFAVSREFDSRGVTTGSYRCHEEMLRKCFNSGLEMDT